jgi:uncharacterized phage protein gp47/JayE
MSTFSSTGYTIDRYSDIFDALVADLQAAFGDNIKTDADSVFGQLAAIWSEMVADVNESIEGIVAAYDPQGAEGAFLSKLVLLNGIERTEAAFSSVTLQCTANAAGATIPAGSLVSDPAVGDQFATDSILVVAPSSTGNVSATAVNAGPTSAVAGTLTQIDSPIYGWESVTNPSAAVEGNDEETDTELRVRRQVAAERTGLNNVPAIYTAIANVDSVEQVTVYQNIGTTTDANGVPPQHIWAIVLGGADQDIAGAIFGTVAAGIGMTGDTPVSYADPITGDTYTVTFERPDDVPVYITVEVTTDDDYPADGDTQIEDALIAYFEANQGIGDDVEYSRLYTPINSVDGHYVTALKIGFAPSPTGTTNLSIDADERATTDAAKIVVTSV